MFAKIWAVVLPILKNPGTWAAIIAIAGALFGAPGVGLLAPAPTVTMPESMSVQPMEVFRIPVTHTGKNLELDCSSPNAKVFGPLPDGSYFGQIATAGQSAPQEPVHFFAHSARGSKMSHAHLKVTVGDAPTPPGPNPPPPGPTDPFVKGLQDAYTAETDAKKADHVAFLAGIYKAFAGSVATDTTLHTLADLFNKLHTAIEAPGVGLAKGDMLKVRAYVGSDMNTVIGTQANTPLDATLRTKVATEFTKIANALSEVH